MILVVTSSSQALVKIEHSMLSVLRLDLADQDFVRARTQDEAMAILGNDFDGKYHLVIVAEQTFSMAVEFESRLRLEHPTMPLIVVHRAERIKSLRRSHSADISLPIKSGLLDEILQRLLPQEVYSSWAPVNKRLVATA